jgi:hypothetical protein
MTTEAHAIDALGTLWESLMKETLPMPTHWKISTNDRRAIRAYAAQVEGLKPGQIELDVGERYNLDSGKSSINVYRVDTTPDWEESDLRDLWNFYERVGSVPLDTEGRACVDFYVYKKDRDRELLTNVQAYVETVDGKPKLVKLSSTAARSIGIPQIRALGTRRDSKGGTL